MTLIELVLVLSLVDGVMGLVAMEVAGRPHGLVVFVILVGWVPALMGLLYTIAAFVDWWVPDLPRCERRDCRAGGYRYVAEPGLPDLRRVRCLRCGRRYQHSETPDGVLRFERIDDGTAVPYLARRNFRRWRPDRSPRQLHTPYRTAA